MSKLLAALLLGALAGCAATPERNYQPAQQEVSTPPLGVVRDAGIGDDILRQGHAVLYEAISVAQKLGIAQDAYTLAPGLYRKIGQNADGEFFVPWGGAEGGQIVKIPWADDPQALVIRPDGQLCVVTALELAACGTKTGFERTRHQEAGRSGDQVLVYNGRSGDRITVAYRGPSGAADGSSSASTAQYDLSESHEIAYRGARIQVLEATSSNLKYRVLSGFK